MCGLDGRYRHNERNRSPYTSCNRQSRPLTLPPSLPPSDNPSNFFLRFEVCAACSTGYGKDVANGCHKCSDSFKGGMYFVLAVVGLLTIFVVTLLTVYLVRNGYDSHLFYFMRANNFGFGGQASVLFSLRGLS